MFDYIPPSTRNITVEPESKQKLRKQVLKNLIAQGEAIPLPEPAITSQNTPQTIAPAITAQTGGQGAPAQQPDSAAGGTPSIEDANNKLAEYSLAKKLGEGLHGFGKGAADATGKAVDWTAKNVFGAPTKEDGSIDWGQSVKNTGKFLAEVPTSTWLGLAAGNNANGLDRRVAYANAAGNLMQIEQQREQQKATLRAKAGQSSNNRYQTISASLNTGKDESGNDVYTPTHVTFDRTTGKYYDANGKEISAENLNSNYAGVDVRQGQVAFDKAYNTKTGEAAGMNTPGYQTAISNTEQSKNTGKNISDAQKEYSEAKALLDARVGRISELQKLNENTPETPWGTLTTEQLQKRGISGNDLLEIKNTLMNWAVEDLTKKMGRAPTDRDMQIYIETLGIGNNSTKSERDIALKNLANNYGELANRAAYVVSLINGEPVQTNLPKQSKDQNKETINGVTVTW